MYINEIDDLIDKLIDDFSFELEKNKTVQQVVKEQNFVKYQNDINIFLQKYANGIDTSKIKNIVKSNDSIYTIIETIKKYIAMYFFLFIGFFYTGKDDTFINNIVEFTKNQSNYSYKIENFFNSESNASIINLYSLVKNIVTLITVDDSKLNIIKNKDEYKKSIDILNTLGVDFINKYFKLKNKNNQSHNIIKTIIINNVYNNTDKKDFFKLIELSENVEGDYMFIDIVVPTRRYIDFNVIESIIPNYDKARGLEYLVWNFLKDIEKSKDEFLTNDEKIVILINSRMIQPLSDDFLLYNKSVERYDKGLDSSELQSYKKKEETKIKYIIGKIDNTSNLYSDLSKRDKKVSDEILKNFYVPMSNRKAILVNSIENMKIIKKFVNMDKSSIKNVELFNDLSNYMLYPYINFKDFEYSGFSLLFNKTIDVIRSVNFTHNAIFKTHNKNSILQTRIGSKDMIVNIVGFMIGSNNKNVKCLKIKNVLDVRTLSKSNKNGYDLFIKYLKETKLNTKKHNSSIYWIFNTSLDTIKMDSYEQQAKFTSQEQVKHMVAKLYDDVINELYYEILSDLEKHKNLTLQKAYKIISRKEYQTIDIMRNSSIYNDLESKIYELIIKTKPSYDKNDDNILGFTDDSVMLPDKPRDKINKIQKIKVNLKSITEEGVTEKNEKVTGVCQHMISWDTITVLKNRDPKLFQEKMYQFIKQYVTENLSQNYICKSCGTLIDIQKYVIDGEFDNDTQQFITFNMPLSIPLENIKEYEKYNIAIRNMDKLINNISVISNIPSLTGSTYNVKSKRRTIVKDAIDIILANYSNLGKTSKTRNENAVKKYGVNSSNIFMFDLDNNIFVFSSKDKDTYKTLKQNNILAYLIILIMLEISESQVSYVGITDKKGFCNFQTFTKLYKSMFSGLNIRKNTNGDVESVINYKILCYLLYITACSVNKYNLWYFAYPEGTKKSKYAIPIQKVIIHTIVDILNSILEIASSDDSSSIYKILSSKFYRNLSAIFSNNELYERFTLETKSKVSKTKIDLSKLKSVSLREKRVLEFDDPPRTCCRPVRYFPKTPDITKFKLIKTNITNCLTGSFHKWEYKDKTYVCALCGVSTIDLKLNKQNNKTISENYKNILLQSIAEIMCIVDAFPHQWITGERNEIVCKKCGNKQNHKYSQKDLDKIETIVSKNSEKNNELVIKNIESDTKNYTEKEKYIEKLVGVITKNYESNITKDNKYKFIDNLIDELKTVISSETTKSTDIYLKDNTYVIDHDHLGLSLSNKIIISDSDKKIFKKNNHPFFKKDVIYYVDYKNGKTDVFYDALTHVLLGYKEENKNYIISDNTTNKITINLSIYNKLKYLGYVSQIINVKDEYKSSFEGFEDIKSFNKKIVTKYIINEIVRSRHVNLKKSLVELQKLIFRIINDFQFELNKDNENKFYENQMLSILDKYKKQLLNMKITNDKNEHQVFKHWHGVHDGIFPKINDDDYGNFDLEKSTNIDVNDINDIDKNGNIILSYIVSELSKLLSYNKNTFIKNNLAYFINDYVNTIFGFFNEEKYLDNFDYKKFTYILSSQTYVRETETALETEGLVSEISLEELRKQNKLKDEQKEIDDAYDMDMGKDDGEENDGDYDYSGEYTKAEEAYDNRT